MSTLLHSIVDTSSTRDPLHVVRQQSAWRSPPFLSCLAPSGWIGSTPKTYTWVSTWDSGAAIFGDLAQHDSATSRIMYRVHSRARSEVRCSAVAARADGQPPRASFRPPVPCCLLLEEREPAGRGGRGGEKLRRVMRMGCFCRNDLAAPPRYKLTRPCKQLFAKPSALSLPLTFLLFRWRG